MSLQLTDLTDAVSASLNGIVNRSAMSGVPADSQTYPAAAVSFYCQCAFARMPGIAQLPFIFTVK